MAGRVEPTRAGARRGERKKRSFDPRLAGIGVAVQFFLRNTDAARRLAMRYAGLHTLLANKYYVDEVYDATIIKPVGLLSEHGLWRALDVRSIDASVNGVAGVVGGSSDLLRRIQTGSVRAYAASLVLGVALVLGFYLWR